LHHEQHNFALTDQDFGVSFTVNISSILLLVANNIFAKVLLDAFTEKGK
jgi:hypothetical protein